MATHGHGYHIPRQAFWLVIGFTCILLGSETNGKEIVTITKFEVPHHVRIHDNVTMLCEYDVKPDRVGYLLWRHNSNDFYKFAVDEEGRKIIYEDTGLTVDEKQSSVTKLVLLNVNRTAAGIYECEVSGETPDFDTDSKQSEMIVAVIPEERPKIEPPPVDGLRIGSNVEFNCSSSPSYPAPELDWEVNGKKVLQDDLRTYPQTEDEDGLIVQTLGLHFKVEKKHFVNSELKLKCTVRILSLYDRELVHTHQHMASKKGAGGEGAADPGVEGELINANGRGVCFSSGSLWLMAGLAVALALYR